MKISLGVDIEEVRRFYPLVRRSSFLNRLFTSEEISYYESKGKNLQTLAGMFAGKEAVIKALSELLGTRYAIGDFAIVHDKMGTPVVLERGKRKVKKLPRGITISLSISHTKNIAVAIALAQRS
jgi:holo-[acyl-carrier protein] synthase